MEHDRNRGTKTNAFMFRYIFQPSIRVDYISSTIKDVMGYSTQECYENLNFPLAFIHPFDQKLWEEILSNPKDQGILNLRWIHKNGKEIWMEQRYIRIDDEVGNCIGIEGFSEIIKNFAPFATHKGLEDLEKEQEYIANTHKMEAIGQLAANIVHDFNNILGGIIGYADISQMDVNKESPLGKNLQKILKASKRGKHLVRQILSYSREGKERKIFMHLRPIVKESIDFLKRSIPSTILMKNKLEKDTKTIFADPMKVQEVLVQLSSKAIQSMKDKGEIYFSLYEKRLEEEEMGKSERLNPTYIL